MIIMIILVLPVFIYTYLLISYRISWIPFQNNIQCENPGITVDVIIPFRNEQINIIPLVQSLKDQDYDAELSRFILVDDHSEDNSFQQLSDLICNDKRFLVIQLNNEGMGKKNALIAGIKNSNAKVVLFSDADCIHPKEWITSMINCYVKSNAYMVLGPVVFTGKKNFISRFSDFEFSALMGVTASAINKKRPLMCNGANLLIQYDILAEFNDYFNTKYVSGDDMFLLLKMKKYYPDFIKFNNSKDAIVTTIAPYLIRDFILQRLRWVSKNKGINDLSVIFNSSTVFLTNSMLLISAFLFLIKPVFLYIFIALFLIKTITDLIFIYPVLNDFNKKTLLKYIVIFEGFNLFYVPVITISGIFSNIKWKDRFYQK